MTEIPTAASCGPSALSPLVFASVTPADLDEIGDLNATVFGPGRLARTAYRVRERVPPDLSVSILARRDERLVGSVLQSRIAIGGERGLWLGPIAVTAEGRNAGVGATLMARAIACAAESDARFILLIGDLSYYGRFGFAPVPPDSIRLPGPVDPARFLGLSLTPLPILPVGPLEPQ